jgi:hypothetical protein
MGPLHRVSGGDHNACAEPVERVRQNGTDVAVADNEGPCTVNRDAGAFNSQLHRTLDDGGGAQQHQLLVILVLHKMNAGDFGRRSQSPVGPPEDHVRAPVPLSSRRVQPMSVAIPK